MRLYSIRAVMDASLFCPQPCILATFSLNHSDVERLNQHDDTVQAIATSQLSEIDLDLSTTQSSLPVFIRLIKRLTEEMMKRLELDCGPAIVSRDDSQKAVFIAFIEKDRMLTSSVLTQVINFVLNLYSQEALKGSTNTQSLISHLKYLLDHSANMGKMRATKDIQRSLMAGKKPWISLDFNHHSKDLFQIGFGRQQQFLKCTLSFESSHMGVVTSLSKMKSQQFLSQLGFSVPIQATANTADKASQLAHQLGFPVVLKSDFGARGSRVYADLRNPEEVSVAFHALKEDKQKSGHRHDILIEEFIQGRVYRVEVIKGQFFDAYDMIPAGVIGDGIHTIKELVGIENQKPNRNNKSDSSSKYVSLQLDAAELLMLKKQGMSITSAPENGQEVRLSANSNWSRGGTFKNVSEHVHKDNQQLAERIAAVLKIDLLGIDIITSDISKSFIDESLKIIEVNHFPGIGSYYDDDLDKFVDVSSRLIQRLLPDAAYGDVPVIMFKACELSIESETLLAEILNKQGYSAGLINRQGLTVNGQLWAKPEQVDYKNPGLQLLRNNTVGAAIIDQSAGNLADFGMGSGGCDIAVILNSQNSNIVTPIWPLGISTQKTDKLLSLSARSTSIVYIENSESLQLCQQCPPEKLFALFLMDMTDAEQLLELGVNQIKLLKQTEEGILLSITYKNNHYEKWLNLQEITNPLPYLALLATLLVLGFDFDKAKAVIESQ